MADYRSVMDYQIMENVLVNLQRYHLRMTKDNPAYKELDNGIKSLLKVLPLIKPDTE